MSTEVPIKTEIKTDTKKEIKAEVEPLSVSSPTKSRLRKREWDPAR